MTPEIAGSVGLPSATGSLVTAVQPNGPAAKAKMEQGDVILSFNGQDVAETRELPRIVAATPAGKPVDVVVWRNGERKTLRVTVAQMKEDEKVACRRQQRAGWPAAGHGQRACWACSFRRSPPICASSWDSATR